MMPPSYGSYHSPISYQSRAQESPSRHSIIKEKLMGSIRLLPDRPVTGEVRKQEIMGQAVNHFLGEFYKLPQQEQGQLIRLLSQSPNSYSGNLREVVSEFVDMISVRLSKPQQFDTSQHSSVGNLYHWQEPSRKLTVEEQRTSVDRLSRPKTTHTSGSDVPQVKRKVKDVNQRLDIQREVTLQQTQLEAFARQQAHQQRLIEAQRIREAQLDAQTGQQTVTVGDQLIGSFSWKDQQTQDFDNAIPKIIRDQKNVAKVSQECSGVEANCRQAVLAIGLLAHRKAEVLRDIDDRIAGDDHLSKLGFFHRTAVTDLGRRIEAGDIVFLFGSSHTVLAKGDGQYYSLWDGPGSRSLQICSFRDLIQHIRSNANIYKECIEEWSQQEAMKVSATSHPAEGDRVSVDSDDSNKATNIYQRLHDSIQKVTPPTIEGIDAVLSEYGFDPLNGASFVEVVSRDHWRNI